MNLIESPSIFLIARQQIDQNNLDAFLESEGVEKWSTDTEVAGQVVVEVGGRLCYKSYSKPRPGGNAAYIEHILEVGHGSVLEHATFTFIVTGVSRSFTHELIRHRAGFGYSQRSQRFCDETDASFVIPDALREEVTLARQIIGSNKFSATEIVAIVNGQFRLTSSREEAVLKAMSDKAYQGLRWIAHMERCHAEYAQASKYLFEKFAAVPDKTLRRKKAREAARSTLPNATETQIQVTGNARAIRHLMEMRGDASADAEIRQFACALCEVMKVEAPNIFPDFGFQINPQSGERSLISEHPKV
jgi:thymidylate synthase (FAD)